MPAFTDQPAELKGYSIHTRLSKGPRGFGFNIVGGSKQREFLQVYSVTPGGPPALSTGRINTGTLNTAIYRLTQVHSTQVGLTQVHSTQVYTD